MLTELNKNVVPKDWIKNKNLNIEIKLEKWLHILKYIYDTNNKWINDGSLSVYDLAALYNTKLFIITLPIYFQKKLEENQLVSSDKIIIEYKLTKYEKIEEINEEILEKIKKQNGDKDFILIKGLKIRHFESLYEKDSRVYQENLNKKEGEELPIVLVTYSINSFDNIKQIQVNDEEEDSDDDNNISTKKSQKHLDDASISKNESHSISKEIEEESYDVVQDISQVNMPKKKYSHSHSVYLKDKTIKKAKVNILQKYKYFSLKKYCKINVPFIEENKNEIYGLDEPLGYIELKIKCTNDKQEEYFINNKIHIEIDVDN